MDQHSLRIVLRNRAANALMQARYYKNKARAMRKERGIFEALKDLDYINWRCWGEYYSGCANGYREASEMATRGL